MVLFPGGGLLRAAGPGRSLVQIGFQPVFRDGFGRPFPESDPPDRGYPLSGRGIPAQDFPALSFRIVGGFPNQGPFSGLDANKIAQLVNMWRRYHLVTVPIDSLRTVIYKPDEEKLDRSVGCLLMH